MRFLFFFVVLPFLLASPTKAAAEAIAAGGSCSQIGASTMATAQDDLVVCLKDGNGDMVWKSMTSSDKCTGSIGTVCSDGTIIAGGGLYVPPCDLGMSGTKASCAGTRAGLKVSEAFAACKNLTTGGHKDWYLPNANELAILSLSYASIGGFDPTAIYWSFEPETYSTGSGSLVYSWARRFSDGLLHIYTRETYSFPVRCVRR